MVSAVFMVLSFHASQISPITCPYFHKNPTRTFYNNSTAENDSDNKWKQLENPFFSIPFGAFVLISLIAFSIAAEKIFRRKKNLFFKEKNSITWK